MGAPPGPRQGIEQGAGWSTRARSRLGNRAVAAAASRTARRPRRWDDGAGTEWGVTKEVVLLQVNSSTSSTISTEHESVIPILKTSSWICCFLDWARVCCVVPPCSCSWIDWMDWAAPGARRAHATGMDWMDWAATVLVLESREQSSPQRVGQTRRAPGVRQNYSKEVNLPNQKRSDWIKIKQATKHVLELARLI